MSVINIKNLTFGYDGNYENVFEDVSLSIDTDWRLGLTGRNGRGKTTFLKLLLGMYEYRGSIVSNVTFDYFPFEIEDEEMSGLDVAETMCLEFEYWELCRELNLLGLEDEILYRPVNTLSNGEKTKLMLAVLFLKQDNFLLIDEPTNHLDRMGREKVSRYLESKKGFILVSHDRRFLDNCVDHILSINRADIELHHGDFSSWYYNKQLKDEFEKSSNEKLKREINRLSSAAKQSGKWADKVESTRIGKKSLEYERTKEYAAERSRKMQRRRKSLETQREKAIEEKESLLRNVESTDSLKISQLKSGGTIVKVKDLSVKYNGRKINRSVSFEIKDGEKILLSGSNGSGKSSIIKAIANGTAEFEGSIEKGNNIVISYVPQDTSFLKGGLHEFASEREIDESLFKTILRKMDFSRSLFDRDMESYSDGQKKKVLIAMSLCQRAHLYIWDEPLNYIDVFSRMQIEELISEYNPAMLFVEHDIEFGENIADSVIKLEAE